MDNWLSGADNTSAMHARTTHTTQTAAAHLSGELSVHAAVAPVAALPLTVLPVVVSVSTIVSITGIVIICPAGGVLG